jgi:hypothetical protein
VKGEPQPSVAQPGDTRVNASVFEFGVEVAQERRCRCLMLESVDADFNDVTV